MLNRKLVLGSLVAGAFLLPLTANAGVVSGPCVNCHTMHDSQNGVGFGGPNGQLLKGSGCITCHAHGADNGATGVASTGIPAPQVDGLLATVNKLAGGYFDATGNDAQQHNVAGIVPAVDGDLGTMPPGGAVDPGTQITCAGCHGGSGGHHGTGNAASARTGTTGSDTYRMLYNGAVGVEVLNGSITYGVNDATVSGYVSGTQAASTNNINAFCATCHGLFHGAGNQGSQATAWVRHPTDWSLTQADPGNAAALVANYALLTPTEMIQLPLGNDGTDTDSIMCITCHRPHGSAYADNLRYLYNDGTNNEAGDTTASFGCESCHGVK